MSATPQHDWTLEEDDDAVSASLEDARAQDAYWAEAYRHGNYCRSGLDYEDYAPAYCVGYIGRVQYGGDFADAEKSLLANWLRIKGDSRLGLDEARMAIRAAWDRAGEPQQRPMARRPVTAALQAWVRELLQAASRSMTALLGPRTAREHVRS
jgi:hypothetical protein